jgi:glycosyltransferase involved in cell wall biosynthesis
VVNNYSRYLPDYDIEVVNRNAVSFDLTAAHAGAYPGANVAHVHGLYWSADYEVMRYEHRSNQDVITTIRNADQITVPSAWVAETITRDIRLMPHVIPHGINWEEWQHDREPGEYVLWNKNRNLDVCNPYYVGVLANELPDRFFISTFAPTDLNLTKTTNNLRVTGVLPHENMKPLIQSAAVYLNTTKETFGIGILEAMASGVPILAFNHGGAVDLVEHGVNGYLAIPNNVHDLKAGLEYCFQYSKELGENGREMARKWTWQNAVEQVAKVYEAALNGEQPTVSVIIPTYNYADKVERAIESAYNQTYKPVEIIIVDDGSEDDTVEVVNNIIARHAGGDTRISLITQENQGVAHARNAGIRKSFTKYVCCLDADDAIEPQFLEVCVEALEADKTLGIAYTGLTFVLSDGTTGGSKWPEKFDYDRQLAGANQIPTCCVFRREMWERLGGYRQRYAPQGAGAEDAEFWLRAGAYGWNARKVTEAGLFVYSWMSGRVSGNEDYQEPNWRAWHPWVNDNQHPFGSLATPINGLAHPVRSYDEPEISVVIPVGVGHEEDVINALDSLEAQTSRRWEAIVVWDSPDSTDELERMYPYVNFVKLLFMQRGYGAGFARNRGADEARAPLLLFLDADDWLYPEALEKMFKEWETESSIIYTDYVGKAFISPHDLSKIDNQVLYHNNLTHETVIRYNAADYDCERAVKQPDEDIKDAYIWNLIASLVPTEWHEEIGGFDENMESWEDWDYWIRMARAGKCFVRIPEELVVYRFYTGGRREVGLQSSQTLLQYMIDKKEGASIMGCGCTQGTRQTVTRPAAAPLPQRESEMMAVEDANLVLVIYQHPNRGGHRVVGPATGTEYGYRGGGDRFYVQKQDVRVAPHLFVPIETAEAVAKKAAPPPPPQPAPAPVGAPAPMAAPVTAPVPSPVAEGFDLQTLPGVTPQIAMGLQALGAHTPEDVVNLGVDGLRRIKGIGDKRAEAIIAYIQDTL